MRIAFYCLLALVLCFSAACGDDDGRGDSGTNDADTGTGGSDTGTPDPGGTVDCMAGCEAQLAGMCEDGPETLEECLSQCEQSVGEAVAAGCGAEARTSAECVLNAADFCEPNECRIPAFDVVTCINSATYTVSGSTCAEMCAAQTAGGCENEECMVECTASQAAADGCERYVQSLLDCVVSNAGACSNECIEPAFVVIGCTNPI